MSLFERPATWPELQLMQGTPPPPERLVTPDTWIEGPFNRWAFLHVRELAHTARISRGDGPATDLPADPQDAGIFSGYGINGQQLLIHHPSQTVIARFAMWPTRWHDRLAANADAQNRAILDALG